MLTTAAMSFFSERSLVWKKGAKIAISAQNCSHYLKNVHFLHTVFEEGLVEPADFFKKIFYTVFLWDFVLSLVDVLHHLEAGPAGVDLGDDPGAKLVHQVAKEDAVLK